MTLAPRVEVYTQIACRTLYDSSSPTPSISSASPLHLPTLPHTSGVVHVQFRDSPVQKLDECAADPRVQARAARIQACWSSSSVYCGYLDVTDTPQLSKQQRVFLVLRQQAGLAISVTDLAAKRFLSSRCSALSLCLSNTFYSVARLTFPQGLCLYPCLRYIHVVRETRGSIHHRCTACRRTSRCSVNL